MQREGVVDVVGLLRGKDDLRVGVGAILWWGVVVHEGEWHELGGNGTYILVAGIEQA